MKKIRGILTLLVVFGLDAFGSSLSEISFEREVPLPEWAKSLTIPLLDKSQKYVLAFAKPGRLEVYQANGEIELIYTEPMPGLAQVIGFSQDGKSLAVIDKSKAQLSIYGPKNEKWQLLTSVKEDDPSDGGFWTPAGRLITFNNKKKKVSSYYFTPQGEIKLMRQYSFESPFTFAIDSIRSRQQNEVNKNVTQEASFFGRLMARTKGLLK